MHFHTHFDVITVCFMLDLWSAFGMQTVKAVPGAVHALVMAYIYLSFSQKGLNRVEEAETSLQKGLDATKSPLLQKAFDTAQSSARLHSSLARRGPTPFGWDNMSEKYAGFWCVVAQLLLPHVVAL